MSLPNIPDITPKISLKKHEVINLLLASIAMEEIGLSHILNAEGEKIQAILKNQPSISDLLYINRSLDRTLRNVIKTQILLHYKLEDILDREYYKTEPCEDIFGDRLSDKRDDENSDINNFTNIEDIIDFLDN